MSLELILLAVIVLVIIIGFIALRLFKMWISRRHTRERFAFFTVQILSYTLISIISILTFRNQFLDLLIHILNTYWDLNYEEADVAISFDLLFWTTFIMLAIVVTALSLYKNWNGPTSERENRLIELGQQHKLGIFKDFIFYLRNKDQIEIYEKPEVEQPEVFTGFEPDTRAWHQKAANFLNLLDQQYLIREKDWYGEYDAYISQYGQDNERMGVLCVKEKPDEKRVKEFIDFVKSRPGQFHKLIIAIDEEGESSLDEIDGYKVEFRFNSEMLMSLVPLSRYKQFVTEYFNKRDLENSQMSLSDIYVPLGGHSVAIANGKIEMDQELQSVEHFILKWVSGERSHSNEHLVLLGEYGQGKTVLVHKLILEILENPEQYDRIPILIELRGLSPRNDDEMAIFGRWANRFQAKAEALWELHQAGKLLIILDGFDEMDLVGDTELLFNHFTQLWNLARVLGSQIIISGRPNLFADDEERRMALGIQSPRVHLPYSRGIYLGKLTDLQIEKVLRNVRPTTRKGILTALSNSGSDSSFGELISRPSTLFQLSTVWDKELQERKEQLNSATVIGSFLYKAYDRQDSKDANQLTSVERHYFMMGIALGIMLDTGYSNQIKHKDLKRLVENLWSDYPSKLPPYRDAFQGRKYLEYLPIRLKENVDPIGTILKEVRAAGVLVQDLSGRDIFKFSHKSYLEYLISEFFTGYILQSENDRILLMMVNAIAKTTSFIQTQVKSSPDVDNFIAELVASQIEIDESRENLEVLHKKNMENSDKILRLLIRPSNKFVYYFPRIGSWLRVHKNVMRHCILGLSAFAVLLIWVFFKSYLSPQIIFAIWAFGMLSFVFVNILFKQELKNVDLGYKKDFPDFLVKAKLYYKITEIKFLPKRLFSREVNFLIQSRNELNLYYLIIVFQNLIVTTFSFYLLALLGTFIFLDLSKELQKIMVTIGLSIFPVLTIYELYLKRGGNKYVRIMT